MTDYTPYKGTVSPPRLRARIDAAMNDICDLQMDAREVAELCLAMEERDALAAHLHLIKEYRDKTKVGPGFTVAEYIGELQFAIDISPTIKPNRLTAIMRAEGAEMVRDRLREKANNCRTKARQQDSAFYHRCANVADNKAKDLRKQAEAEH